MADNKNKEYRPGQDLPDEEGLQEEGLFDIVRPYKEAAIKAVKDNVDHPEAAAAIAGLIGMAIPDSPLGVGNPLKAAPTAPNTKSILQKVKFPEAAAHEAEGAIKGTAQAATAAKFNAMHPAVQDIKRKEAIEALTGKAPAAPVKKVVKPYSFSSDE